MFEPLMQTEPVTPALPPIVLASGSPRRRELLAGLGLSFEVVLPTVNEKDLAFSDVSPAEKALALARYKGASVALGMSDSVVIASDTLVVLDGQVLEKPEDREDAFRMLSLLQGREHSVISGIAVFYQREEAIDFSETRVWMRGLSAEQIWEYIETGEPMDKAGAYAIQGVGSLLIERIDGCYFNVVGMSLVLLDSLCARLGVRLIF